MGFRFKTRSALFISPTFFLHMCFNFSYICNKTLVPSSNKGPSTPEKKSIAITNYIDKNEEDKKCFFAEFFVALFVSFLILKLISFLLIISSDTSMATTKNIN